MGKALSENAVRLHLISEKTRLSRANSTFPDEKRRLPSSLLPPVCSVCDIGGGFWQSQINNSDKIIG